MMKEKAKTVPGGDYLEVSYGLQTIGNQRPYFSVIGSRWSSRAAARRHPDNPRACGRLHEEILRAFPDMADIVRLHLSNDDGVPMHAQANGWYFYERGERDAAAQLLRLDVGELRPGLSREEFAALVDAQRPRWAAEAQAARAKYDL